MMMQKEEATGAQRRHVRRGEQATKESKVTA
jgi:hypothetical protein